MNSNGASQTARGENLGLNSRYVSAQACVTQFFSCGVTRVDRKTLGVLELNVSRRKYLLIRRGDVYFE
jgi:hypothetical protein